MNNIQAQAVAEKLTKAQRRYMRGDARQIGNPAVTILIGADARAPKTAPTRRALYRWKLTETGRFGPTSLTPLGEQVRRILQDTKS